MRNRRFSESYWFVGCPVDSIDYWQSWGYTVGDFSRQISNLVGTGIALACLSIDVPVSEIFVARAMPD